MSYSSLQAFLAAEIPNSKEPIIKMNFHSFENKYFIIFQISKNKLPIVEKIFEISESMSLIISLFHYEDYSS